MNNLYHADIECNLADDEQDQGEPQDENLGLGHINNRYLMKTSKAVREMEIVEESKSSNSPREVISCQAFCVGKQSKKSMPSRQSPRAQEVGQRVHVDIGGPVGATSLGGGKYYIPFKDEFSSYRFIYVMKSREEAYECIKKVVATIVADAKKNVRCIVSDSDSEFIPKRSQDRCSSEEGPTPILTKLVV